MIPRQVVPFATIIMIVIATFTHYVIHAYSDLLLKYEAVHPDFHFPGNLPFTSLNTQFYMYQLLPSPNLNISACLPNAQALLTREVTWARNS